MTLKIQKKSKKNIFTKLQKIISTILLALSVTTIISQGQFNASLFPNEALS